MKTKIKYLITVAILLVLTACASNQEVIRYKPPQEDTVEVAAEQARKQEAIAAQKVIEEREKARKIEQERIAAAEAEAKQAEEERLRALALRQRQAEIARDQARIRQLEQQIAASKKSTENMKEANNRMRQAVAVAEELVSALTTESRKYANTDPLTGETIEALDKDLLENLKNDKDLLKQEARDFVDQAQ